MSDFAPDWRKWHQYSADQIKDWGAWVSSTAVREPEWAGAEIVLALGSLRPPSTELEWQEWEIRASELAHEVWVAHGGDPEQIDCDDYWNAAEEAWWSL